MNRELRILRIRQAAGELRTAHLAVGDPGEHREHLVVPVVALMEGVIFPVNAATPELVLAAELQTAPGGWNGEPVTWDHPVVAGKRVSANVPTVLESYQVGQIFNAHVEDKKLKMEAWIDVQRAAEMGGEALALLERIKAGDAIEVSVGAFVVAEARTGIHTNGKRYSAVWTEIVPDHLAMLPAGATGACSNEMGCGAPRAAEAAGLLHTLSGDVLLLAEGDFDEGPAPMEHKTIAERFKGLGEFLFRSNQGGEGMSDTDLRSLIEAALFSSEAALIGVEAIFPETSEVVYATAPEDGVQWFSRGFTVGEDGAVSFGEATEVRPVTKFEAATTAPPCGCEDHDACHCGTEQGEQDMDKAQRIAALIANTETPYTAADTAALEAMSDGTLTALEAAAVETPTPAAPAAPAAPPAPAETPVVDEEETPIEPVEAEAKTDEELIQELPATLRSMIRRQQAEDGAKKTTLIALLSKGQEVFTEAQLGEKSIEQLEEIAALAKVMSAPTADYSGLGTPRVAETGAIPSAPDMNAAIRTAREKTVN